MGSFEARLTGGEPFAVLSDIHANISALDDALRRVRDRSIRSVVMLGDLLTYGCAPVEVLDRLAGPEFAFVRGNHDLYYGAAPSELASLRQDVLESVAWNHAAIGDRALPDAAEEIEAGPLLLAHASPFGFGDWTYLERTQTIARAAEELRRRGLRAGIFGHSHRPRVTLVDEAGRITDLTAGGGPVDIDLTRDVAIVNAGSVGQPRGAGSTFLVASLAGARLTVEHVALDYDCTDHIARIEASGLSPETRSRLLGCFGR